MHPCILSVHVNKDQRRTYLMTLMRCFLCVSPYFFIEEYVVGTHLNCIDKSIQFTWVPTTCLHKEVEKKYTGCNLKTMELFDCVLLGVCAVIRWNTVC